MTVPEKPTVIIPDTPIEVSAEDLNQIRPPRPMATATAEKTTALPLVAMDCSTASPTLRPRASSSRKRLTMNSE